MATEPTTDAQVAHETMGRSMRLLLLALGLAAVGSVDHFVPIAAAMRAQIAAVSLVWICGLGVLTWLPRQRVELAFSTVLAGGLSLNVLAASLLLVVDAYTPDRAAVGAGGVALLLLALRAIWRPER